jgi:hypothetical protein
MSSASPWCRAGTSVLLLMAARGYAGAQTTSEYAHRVDSLARVWQSMVASQPVDMDLVSGLPTSTIRVGPITVLADSQWVGLARNVAERLAPLAARTYGKLAERLRDYQFVLRDKGGVESEASVLSGIVDPAGRERLRGSDYARANDLFVSWERKTELMLAQEIDTAVASWIKTTIPIDAPTAATWTDARSALVLSRTPASSDCVHGRIERCSQLLGLVEVSDPAFMLFDAASRQDVIKRLSPLLRRADAKLFDRCITAKVETACDSLMRSVPPEALPAPAPPIVRQSFVRFALMIGGDGAFDRFIAESNPRARIEAATKLRADTVIRRWRETLLDTRTSSTAIDMETGISALAWAALCGALALRSSRWR